MRKHNAAYLNVPAIKCSIINKLSHWCKNLISKLFYFYTNHKAQLLFDIYANVLFAAA